MTGFDCESFQKILEIFAPMFHGHTPFDSSGSIVEFEYTTDRKRDVTAADCLGLVLIWTRTRGSLNVLQLVFEYVLNICTPGLGKGPIGWEEGGPDSIKY
jgi:hypothetical protein